MAGIEATRLLDPPRGREPAARPRPDEAPPRDPVAPVTLDGFRAQKAAARVWGAGSRPRDGGT